LKSRELRRRQTLEAEAAGKLRFDNVVAVFIDRYASKNVTVGETKRIFDRYVLPHWNDRLLTEITRSDVVDLLDRVEDNAGLHMANRVLAAVRKLFNWALSERALIEASPIVPGMARKGETSRDRYLSQDEIGLVWAAAESLGYPFGPFVRLLLVTGQRRSEVAAMQWGDLDLDHNHMWVLRAEDTKGGREHFVLLSDLAINILQSAPKVGELVFTTQGERPVSGFSKAKRRLDQKVLSLRRMISTKMGQNPNQIETLPSWRFHDLRRTVATHMEDELGIAPHIIGAVLNHDPRQHKGVTATYLRGRLIAERKRALESWAQFLESIIDRNLVTAGIERQNLW